MDTKILNAANLPDPDDEARRKAAEKVPPVERTNKTVLIIFADNPKTLQFELEETVTLGRRSDAGEQPDVDLAPYGGFPAGVSRVHARVSRDNRGLMLEDLGARNGTYIDGERLEPHMRAPVRNGQAVKFGTLQGWIFYEGLK